LTSKHKGIYYKNEPGRQKRWCARIMVQGKKHNIGTFLTEEEAVEAYLKFVEENKDNLPDRAKNITKNQSDLPRNKDGMIERVCSDCGRIDYFEKIPGSDKCKSCAIKESFKHRPAVGLKQINNIYEIAKEYEYGIGLNELGKKYGLSAMTIRTKLIQSGYTTRNKREANLHNPKRSEINNKISHTLTNKYNDIEERKKISAKRQGISTEQWKEFTTPENKRFYKSPEYKEWRKQVLKNFDFTCQLCKKRGGKLQSHHIKPKCKFPELKLEISNGVCLCHECHNKTKNIEHEYEQFFLDIISKNSV